MSRAAAVTRNLRLFRSLWGKEEYNTEWSVLFPHLRTLGYAGIECSLGDIGERKEVFKTLLAQNKFEFIGGLYTSWQDYEGKWENLSVGQHLDNYKKQLEAVLPLNPVKLNVHSGSDSFTHEQAVEFFSKAIKIEKEFGVTDIVSHETHRGRILFHPFVAYRLLNAFPELMLTADFSHWLIVAERLLDDEESSKIMNLCTKRSRHIHTRVGTLQSPQVDDPFAAKNKVFLEQFQKWWEQIWTHQLERGDQVISATPEYGPTPYASSHASPWNIANRQAGSHRIKFQEVLARHTLKHAESPLQGDDKQIIDPVSNTNTNTISKNDSLNTHPSVRQLQQGTAKSAVRGMMF